MTRVDERMRERKLLGDVDCEALAIAQRKTLSATLEPTACNRNCKRKKVTGHMRPRLVDHEAAL
jgi:hypothetical protein